MPDRRMPDRRMRVALGLEYDGFAFHGWQAQEEGVRSVQACVESALSRVADHPVRVVTAGRTDAGVHAAAQVIHFETRARRDPRAWVFGGNSHLPGDVALQWARPVDDTFHARFSALARHYRYVILDRPTRPGLGRGRIAWSYRRLEVERMAAAAAHLLGTHDFSAYRALGCQAKSPVRTVHRLEVTRHGQRVVIAASANAFLHHMVRNIAGVLMAIGSGVREPEWAREVLEARDRTQGGVTAPPDGLYLVGVDYPPEYALPAPALDGVPA